MSRPNFDVFDIGSNLRPKIIAEIGINHGGSLNVAKSMASAAIKHGADIVKFQSHFPYEEMSKEAESRIPGNSDKSIFQIMTECALEEQEEAELVDYVNSEGGIFLSTPFSRRSVDHLESLGVSAFKIGSGECNNYPFVRYVAKKGKPIILSTGMNDLDSIKKSVDLIRAEEVPLALMHTTNLYPTPSDLLRLGGITELLVAFPEIQVGLSDHSKSNLACLGAVALGASFLERHFTDDKQRSGPDIICSMDGSELAELRNNSEIMFQARGGQKFLSPDEKITADFAFASVSSTRKIEQGEVFTEENIFTLRPARGDYGPQEYDSLIGRIAAMDIDERTQISKSMVRGESEN